MLKAMNKETCMKYKILMESMYDVTEAMNKCIFGICGKSKVFDGKILCYGRLYDSWDQIEFVEKEVWSSEMDFRCKEVSDDVVSYMVAYLKNYMEKFLAQNRDGDLQTLFIGCILNLYYSCGLFDRCGILKIKSIREELFADDKTKEYACIQEQMHLKAIYDTFGFLYNEHLFMDEVVVDEYLQVFLQNYNRDLLEKIIGKINPKFAIASNFVREYIKAWNVFTKCNTDKDFIHDIHELLELCPNYQYANLLLSIFSLQDFFDSKGKNTEFKKYKELLDDEIFNCSIGIGTPSSLEIDYSGGKMATKHPEAFSMFGLGLPYAEFISKNESLGELINSEDFVLTTKNMRNSMSICYPYSFPNDPEDIITSTFTIAINLEEAKKRELKAKEDRHTIVRQFSHTYMNMRATSLYNIAMELLKNPDKQYRNYGRKLLYEYSVKQNLTKDIEMLKLRFEDNEEELYKIISDSILSINDSGVGIDELLDEAIVRCMVTLVHDGSTSAKKLRERFVGFDLISIRNAFENEILLSDDGNVQEWFCNNLFSINVKIDESWKKVVFERDSYAALLFINILSELLTNIFRYADFSKEVKFEFRQDNDSVMIVSSKNYVLDNNKFSEGSGFGLKAEADIFNALNKHDCEDINPIIIKNEDGKFEVEFQVSKKLFEK
jgi:hypothetical protein